MDSASAAGDCETIHGCFRADTVGGNDRLGRITYREGTEGTTAGFPAAHGYQAVASWLKKQKLSISRR